MGSNLTRAAEPRESALLAEARACGAAELAVSSLDGQFESLDNLGNELGLQRRLAALKTGQVPAIAAPQPSPSPADDQSSISG